MSLKLFCLCGKQKSVHALTHLHLQLIVSINLDYCCLQLLARAQVIAGAYEHCDAVRSVYQRLKVVQVCIAKAINAYWATTVSWFQLIFKDIQIAHQKISMPHSQIPIFTLQTLISLVPNIEKLGVCWTWSWEPRKHISPLPPQPGSSITNAQTRVQVYPYSYMYV